MIPLAIITHHVSRQLNFTMATKGNAPVDLGRALGVQQSELTLP